MGGTEFFARLEAAGLLIRERFSQRDPGQVTGYAVAKVGHVNGQGRAGVVRRREART
jgi:hypothetical protein